MKEIVLGGVGRTAATLFTHNAMGASADADATPTVVLFDEYNNDLSATLGEAVVRYATGTYFLVVDGPTVITNGLHAATFWGWWEYEIGGVAQKKEIQPFRFIPERMGFVVVADGSNTATSFEVLGRGPYDTGATLFDTTDDSKDVLITFATGALAGQIRKVTAYNSSTGFVTVDTAFTTAPSAGDAGFVSNY